MSGNMLAETLVDDERGRFVVVTQADDVIWVSHELWDAALQPDREYLAGAVEIDGDLMAVGTVGEGLGRVVYRRVAQGLDAWHVCERQRDFERQLVVP